MLLNYVKNKITISFNGGCRNAYFETKRSGGNDKQNKLNKIRIKRVYAGNTFYDASRPDSCRGAPKFLPNLLKRTFLAFLIGSPEEWISLSGISCMSV